MMSASNPSRAALLFLLILFSFKLSFSTTKNTINFCPETEKQSLLSFKQSVKDPDCMLSSWNGGVNCCKWNGVICDTFTGHVHQLHLPHSEDKEGLEGNISSVCTLLNLKHLSYLDLSGQYFHGGTIPSQIGSFASLRYLNLSDTGFHGKLPHTIGNLSNLRTLDLGSSDTSLLEVDSLEWLSGLSHLEYLNMNGVNFSQATNWVQVITSLPSLLQLHFEDCTSLDFMAPLDDMDVNFTTNPLKHLFLSGGSSSLTSPTIPPWIFQLANLLSLHLSDFIGPIPTISNSTKLQHIDISNCGLNSSIPDWLYFCKDLEYVDLSSNKLSGTVSNSIANLTSLQSFFVQSNKLSGKIPKEITNLCKIQSLDLSHNNFGEIWESSGNMSECFVGTLENLNLEQNQLSGHLTDQFGEFKRLQNLDLSSNLLSGVIPMSLGNLLSLDWLDLRDNKFSGSLPESLGQFVNLQYLYISGNKFSGSLPESLGGLVNLQLLDIANNKFSGNLPESLGGLVNLESLDLSDNKFSGNLPESLGGLVNLERLDLSDNKFSGSLPESLSQLVNLEYLSLNDNKFNGSLPESLGGLFNLLSLNIAHNKLEGVVTQTHFANLTMLHEFMASGNRLTLKVSPNWNPPFQLTTLELASWTLGSRIPSWVETQEIMDTLDLSNTGISGNIPTWAWDVNSLNLSYNHLHGNLQLPAEYQCQYIYLESNQLTGSLPQINDNLIDLHLSSNSFSGGLSHFLCDKTYSAYGLEILLFGRNQLSGELPDCWMKWPQLKYLDIGYNNISGRIPNSIGTLENLRSLNLPNNRLTGEIPFSMHNCTALVKIDLSHNDLDGDIPTWVGTRPVNLTFLILHSNKLSGNISSQICLLKFLQILDLSENNISGMIPRCFCNLTAMATKNRLDFNAYTYSETSDDYVIVITKGSELQYDITLSLVTNIDLSRNNLSGDIPKELTSLVELKSLNLSHNRFTGSIPDHIGDMRELESLDFSYNSLTGHIPQNLTLLSFLSSLNLSYNNLTGEIPQSTQLSVMDASSFVGNHLCGLPLTIRCRPVDKVHGREEEGDEEKSDGESKIEWLYVVLSVGYAVGVSAVCSALALNKSWRDAYFGLLQSLWDKLYVYVCIQWNKLSAPEEAG